MVAESKPATRTGQIIKALPEQSFYILKGATSCASLNFGKNHNLELFGKLTCPGQSPFRLLAVIL